MPVDGAVNRYTRLTPTPPRCRPAPLRTRRTSGHQLVRCQSGSADSRRAAQHGLRSTDHNTKTPITSATHWYGVVAPAVFGCVAKQPSGLVDGEQGLVLTDVSDQFDSGEDLGDEVGAGPAHH